MRKAPPLPLMILLMAALFGSLLLSLTLGAVPLTLKELWFALTHRAADSPSSAILWELRLPRALLAVVVGGALGATGAAFQGLLRNPLADPYIVGVSSGAAVGAALATLLGIAGQWYGIGASVFAFMSGLGTLMLVMALARRNQQIQVSAFLLAGVAIGASLWAVITLLLLWSGEDLSRVLYWLMGGLLNADWRRLEWCLPPVLIGFLMLMSQSRALNLFTTGEETARHLGVPTERLKGWVLVGGSLMTAATVAVAGIIGFVGWMVPHLLRSLSGGDHRWLIPLSAIGGGIALLWADSIARTLARPTELPVGVITALIGTPFFVWMLRKTNG
ncbi:MAG: iron ABC transporter permease [Fimbriimonadia bacterium]|nr:iron ABC transporter permease [Fimbriimonadia bacterium]